MKKRKMVILSVLIFVLFAAGILGAFLMFGKKETEHAINKANIEWYTEDGKEFVLTTEEELYGLVELSKYYDFSGQTIKLGADIILNDGNAHDWAKEAPVKRWYPIDGFAGIFDGQGHSISGIYAYGINSSIGLFANTKMSSTIKNVKVLNSYFEVEGLGAVGSIVSNGSGTFEQLYSDAIVTTDGQNAGGLIGKINDDGTSSVTTKTSIMKNCWFDGNVKMTTKTGRYGGGLVGHIYGGSLTISHCLNTGAISADSKESNGVYLGGIFGALSYINYSGSVTVEDTLNVGKLTVNTTSVTGSLAGGTLGSTTMNITDTYVTEESHTDVCSYQKSATTGSAMMVDTNFIKGEKWYSWTTLNYDEYWTVTKEGTPILQCFADEIIDTSNLTKAYSFDWYNQYTKESIIDSVEDLYGFAIMSYTENFSNRVIKLGADIIVNEGDSAQWAAGKAVPEKGWIPISRIYPFQGVFDGNGYSISGLYAKSPNAFVGLFGCIGNYSEVKNVKVVNSFLEASGALGSITARCEGKIDTAYSNAYLTENTNLAGGIAGYKLNDNVSKITNCWYDGVLTLEGIARLCGGIVGRQIDGTIDMSNCLFSGKIIFNGEKRTVNTGGFIGNIAAGTANIKGCLNTGELIVTEADKQNAAGRVFGQVTNDENITITIEDSYFTNIGFSADFFYYCAGDKPKITGCAELKRTEDILGYNGYRTTSLDFSKYWTVVVGEDSTPILKSFAKKVPSVAGLEKTFDKSWYNPDKDSFVLKDAKDLYGFLYLSNSNNDFKGKTVTLANDIQLNAGLATEWAEGKNLPISAYNWSGIGKHTSFQGTFDGKGHTISGLYGTTDTMYMGLFGYVGTEGTVKNVRLTNSFVESTIEGSAAMGSVVGRLEGNIHTVYSDAILRSSSALNGGIAGYKLMRDSKSSIVNSWYAGTIYMDTDDAKYTGGFIGRIINGEMELNNCLFDGNIVIGGETRSARIGGFAGNVNGTLILKSCLNSGVFEVTEADKMNSTCRIVGQIEDIDTAKLIMENTYATNKGERGTEFYYTSGNKATIKGYAEIKEEEDILGKQGYIATALDFKNYWTIVENADGTPILKSFASNVPSVEGLEKNFDTSWYDASKNTYVLTDEKDLYGFAALSNSNINFKGKTVKLGKDIVVNKTGTAEEWAQGAKPDYAWNYIGRYNAFAGTFDGQGYTISGICGLSDANYIGLFSNVASTGTIKNLRLKNSYLQSLKGSFATGSVVGRLDGNMHTVYSDAILNSATPNNGGIVGYKNTKNENKITNSWFDGTMKVSNINNGGIIGKIIGGSLTIDNCLSTGTIELHKMPKMMVSTGGFVGEVPEEHEVKITNSLVASQFNKIATDKMTAIGRVGGCNWGTLETENVYYAKKDIIDGVSYVDADKITDTDCYSPGVKTGNLAFKKVADITGVDAYFSTQLNFDKDGKWALQTITVSGANGTPVLKDFVESNKIPSVPDPSKEDVTWYSNTATNFNICGNEDNAQNAKELYGFAYLVNQGKTFKNCTVTMQNNVTVNKGTVSEWKENNFADLTKWTPLGSEEAGFAGTFNGNNYTISGIYVNSNEQGAGLFKNVVTGATVKNLKLENSYINSTNKRAGSIVGSLGGNLLNVYSNAEIKSTDEFVGGLVGQTFSSGTANISNCWFAGKLQAKGVAGGIVGLATKGAVTMEDCLNSGLVETTVDYKNNAAGGLLGKKGRSNEEWNYTGSSQGAFTIRQSLNYGEVKGPHNLGSAVGWKQWGTLNVEDVYCTDNTTPTTSSATSGEAVGFVETDAIVGTFSLIKLADIDTTTEGVTKDLICNTTLSELDFANIWKIGKSNRPELIWVTGTLADESWYNETDSKFVISSADELYGLVDLVKKGTDFTGKVIVLGNDITINDGTVSKWKEDSFKKLRKWTPIGTIEYPFTGIFDGDGHTISGIYVDSSDDGVGLFGYTAKGSVIKNLRLEESYISSTAIRVGSIVGSCGGDIQNVSSSAEIVGNASYVGGIAGVISSTNDVMIQNCSYEGQMNVKDCAGGLVGVIQKGNVTIESSYFDGKLNVEGSYVGGIIGSIDIANTTNIKKCYASGTVSSTNGYNIGGILGCIYGAAKVNMENCLNKASVSSGKDTVGGLVARTCDYATIQLDMKYCLNMGQIKGANNVGSLIGWKQNAGSTITNTAVYATKTSDATSGTDNIAVGSDAALAYAKMVEIEDITVSDSVTSADIKVTLNELFGADTIWTIKNVVGSTPELKFDDALTNEMVISDGLFSGTNPKHAHFAVVDTTNATDVTPGDVDYLVEKHSDISAYRIKNQDGYYIIPKAKTTGEWIFAGWYTDANCTVALQENKTNGEGYAKYVSADVMSVKYQLSKETTATSPSTLLRCISSVDTLNYSAVGFELVTSNDAKYMERGTVGTRIQAANNPCTYGPKVVDIESEYFYSAVEEIANADFNKGFLVKPYWVTIDGTKVYGVSRYITVNESINKNIIHIPVKMDAETANATSSVTVNESTATKVTYDADGGYAHYQLAVSNLPSVTKYTITVGGTEQTYFHRNLNTEYTGDGTADKSWYTAYEGTTEDEFVIATSADLYGLSVLTADTANQQNFTNKTIYLGADIEANKGTATVDGWKSSGAGETSYLWTPIGKAIMFNGTFDGQEHTISGIYANESTRTAMFEWTNSQSCIQNFKLVNSYFKNTSTITGSIVGRVGGKISNVYSNAIVNGQSYGNGGIAGQVYAPNTGFDIQIENCQFAGYLYSKGNMAGGILGTQYNGKAFINNCTVSGQLNSELGYVGGILGTSYNGSSFGTCVNVEIKKCTNEASITAKTENAGGFIGYLTGSNSTATLENCLNKGNVKAEGNVAGGFIGKIQNSCTLVMKYCLNIGEVSGPSYIGSLIGWHVSNTCTLDFTSVYGADTSEATGTGTYANDDVAVGNYPLQQKETMIALADITVSSEKTADAIKAILANFNFDTIWTIDTAIGSTPKLQ